MNLRKVARVLECAAEYVDCVEREKAATVESARMAHVDKIASAHVTAHGEEIPDDIRNKLAGADPSVLTYLEGVLAKQAGVVDTLGAGANPADQDEQPKSTKEAGDAAYERFGNWLVS